MAIDKQKLFDVHKHFVAECGKAKERNTIAGDVDALVCDRIAEMLWFLYKES